MRLCTYLEIRLSLQQGVVLVLVVRIFDSRAAIMGNVLTMTNIFFGQFKKGIDSLHVCADPVSPAHMGRKEETGANLQSG